MLNDRTRMAHETTLAVAAATPTIEDTARDAGFLWRAGLLYAALSLLMVLALDRFWSANWDAVTFLESARTFWDGGSPFDLYARSREGSYWPYAYPPLYAIVLAPFVWLADLLSGSPSIGWPQLVALRVPLLVADVAIAATLHRMLWRATTERWIARLGAGVWLFSPILFYHTAVQAHLESLWLWPTLLAYAWLQERGDERAWWPTLLLVVAMAVKQTALLFAVPVGLWLLGRRRWGTLAAWAAMVGLIWGGLALPFWLHSDDFRFMVFEYVGQMPVQIQSWQLWALAFDGWRLDGTRTLFPTVRYAVWLTLALNVALSAWALRRDRSWAAIGVLVTTGFLLTAHKAMAYHYPILLPFAIAWALRARRFRLLGATLLWTTWVLVSPYFAPWAEPSHLPAYAALGTLNSLFYAWLLWQALRRDDAPRAITQPGDLRGTVQLTQWAALLATAFVLAALFVPLRGALLGALASTTEATKLAALLGLMALLVGGVLVATGPVARRASRALSLPSAEQRPMRLRGAHVAGAALFVPLFFTWFTMTAEITRVIEQGIFEAWLG